MATPQLRNSSQSFSIVQGNIEKLVTSAVLDAAGAPVDLSAYDWCYLSLLQSNLPNGDVTRLRNSDRSSTAVLNADGTIEIPMARSETMGLPCASYEMWIAVSNDGGTTYQTVRTGVLAVKPGVQ